MRKNLTDLHQVLAPGTIRHDSRYFAGNDLLHALKHINTVLFEVRQ
jgi:hypothetical protein